MAFTGVHLTFFQSGGDGKNQPFQGLPRAASKSETMGATATSTQTAPAVSFPVVRVRAVADSYIAIGQNPVASNTLGSTPDTARYAIAAATDYDFYCNPGDKVAVIPA